MKGSYKVEGNSWILIREEREGQTLKVFDKKVKRLSERGSKSFGDKCEVGGPIPICNGGGLSEKTRGL